MTQPAHLSLVRQTMFRATAAEAEALLRCLRAEGQTLALPSEGRTAIYFHADDRPELWLRALASTRLRDRVVLEALEPDAQQPGFHRSRLQVPSLAARAALRPCALAELLPTWPVNAEPLFATSSALRPFAHPDGWSVHLESEVRFFGVDAKLIAAPWGQAPLGHPTHQEPRTLVTVLSESPHATPDWLRQIAAGAQPYDLRKEGRAHGELAGTHGGHAYSAREREEALIESWFQ